MTQIQITLTLDPDARDWDGLKFKPKHLADYLRDEIQSSIEWDGHGAFKPGVAVKVITKR